MKDLSRITLIVLSLVFTLFLTAVTASAQVVIPLSEVSFDIDHGNPENVFVPTVGSITVVGSILTLDIPEASVHGDFDITLVKSIREFPDGDNYDEYVASDGVTTIVFIACPVNLEKYILFYNKEDLIGFIFKAGDISVKTSYEQTSLFIPEDHQR